MKYTNDGLVYIIRIDKGEKVIESLLNFLQKEEIKSAKFLGLGALNYVTLRFFKQEEKEFKEINFKENFEITNITGIVTTKNNQAHIHSHISLADENFNLRGGHFVEGIVGATVEISLITDKNMVNRKYSSEINLDLMEF